jgi:hypothetical protein
MSFLICNRFFIAPTDLLLGNRSFLGSTSVSLFTFVDRKLDLEVDLVMYCGFQSQAVSQLVKSDP